MNFFVVICTQIVYFVYEMENKELTTITIRVESGLRDKLASLAESEHRALSNYLRLVLEKHVNTADQAHIEGHRA